MGVRIRVSRAVPLRSPGVATRRAAYPLQIDVQAGHQHDGGHGPILAAHNRGVGPVSTYWTAVGIGAVLAAVACVVAARRPGAVARRVGRVLALVLAADAVAFVLRPVIAGGWSVRGSLPLALCDVALGIAALACWFPGWRLGVELTYFWGLAGSLQAVVTPDLGQRFPDPEFFVFVVAHVGIVTAALYLVAALRIAPRPGSVGRVFAITVGYTAGVGVVDWLAGANYMYLARRPAHASLLSVLGPWPWYLGGAAAVALALFWLLDLPFRWRTRQSRVPRPA
ncbi:MAG: TIGR02206 family membrane protein [Jatrophihabitans sp.]|nr:MAG: TIGR02206 family membrane protein [Jatrophihabitans sp.]